MTKFNKINNTTFGYNKTLHNSLKVDIEIGDIKQPIFYPRAKLKFWDNECNFSVGVIEDSPDGGAQQNRENDKIVSWTKRDVTTDFYSVDELPYYLLDRFEKPSDIKQFEGGLEFEIIIDKKPESNIIPLSMEAKNVEFLYQRFLTDEERKQQGIHRLKCIEGSYAVYHKSKKDGKYGTGKVGHIYRPVAIDDNGVREYCDLNIDGSNLNIIIPEEFYHNCTYPLRVDPTFGHTGIGQSVIESGVDDADITYGTVFRPSGLSEGELQWIHVYSSYRGETENNYECAAGVYNYGTSSLLCNPNQDNFDYTDKIQDNLYWFSSSASGSITDIQYVLSCWAYTTSK